MYKAFLIKYAEIAIKGKNRYIFEDALVDQIRHVLKGVDGEFDVVKERGRIYVFARGEYDYEETVEALKRVFGIFGICPAVVLQDQGYEELAKAVVSYTQEVYGDKTMTFKMDVRRTKKSYPMNSMELNAELGGEILDACPNKKVDVHKPDVFIHVEIRDKIYLYSQVIPGPGGMPVGTGGRAMLLLSGGIDSPVAGYMMAKRGMEVLAVHFVSPPYTSERAKLKVITLCEKMSAYCGRMQLFIVPFTKMQEAIRDNCPEELFTVIMRRMMMKIAEKLAQRSDCAALITGESLAQVASQTLYALGCTDVACELPVLRPVIGMDKNEIIAISRKIGTFETSILPYEDCCTVFTPRHPRTKPKLRDVLRAERNLDEEALLADALSKVETMFTYPER